MHRMVCLSLLLCFALIALTACEDENDETSPGDNQQVGPLDWNRSSDNIVLRVDETRNQSGTAFLANEIPLCTLWGDGRLVWINELDTTREVLEAQLDDEAVRALIETVIFSGFYDWESDFTIPDQSRNNMQSITLNLFSEERTVQRFSAWPAGGFQRILQACQQASDEPVLFLPEGGWVSAIEVTYNTEVGQIPWYDVASGFNLADVAGGAPPRWVSGNLAIVLWRDVILPRTTIHIRDQNQSYELIMQVPRVTRDAPPPPAE
ncbi:MAG: hypothetical protein ACLFTK_06880 [Anaerolineales bacterium]